MKGRLRWIALVGLFGISMFGSCGRHGSKDGGVDVLLLVSENWGLNGFLTRDCLDRYGWSVTTAGVMDSITACPPVDEQMNMHPILPDFLVSGETDPTDFDCVLIPSGSGNYYPVPDAFGDLRSHPETLRLIRRTVEAGIPMYATCSGVRVLAAADVIRGRTVVGPNRFREEFEEAGAVFAGTDHPPSIDGNVITTSRGLFYHAVNAQAVATVVETRGGTGGKRIPRRLPVVSAPIDFSDDRVEWASTYGGTMSDGGNALCATADGGFLMAGYTFSLGGGDSDILVIKTDSRGRMEWARAFGGAGTEYAFDCIPFQEGFLVTGYTTSFGAGSKDAVLLKLDQGGACEWQRTYGGASWDAGTSICPAADGGIYVCGFTHSTGAGEEDVYLIKTDAEGNELWSRTYGGARFEMGNAVAVADDGGLFLGATTGTFGGGNADMYLIRTDAGGEELWSKSFGMEGRRGYGFDCATAMAPAPDGGVVLTGYTDCRDIQDAHAARIGADGTRIWATPFGNLPFYDYGNAVCAAGDGGFLVAGATKFQVQDPRIYHNDFYLGRLGPDGAFAGGISIGNAGNEWANDLTVAEDGTIVVLGHTSSGGAGGLDMCLVRLTNAWLPAE